MLNLIMLFFSFAQASELVIWNVGQGQWVTESHQDFCFHYDLGGERNATFQALRLCGQKKNILFISHWDWDHISFAAPFAAKLSDVCLWQKPLGDTVSWKKKYLLQIPLCPEREKKGVSNYVHSFAPEIRKGRRANPNDLSTVYQSRTYQVLLPGDSPIQKERQWLEKIRLPVHGLVLGHHGSKTSTSKALLDHLSQLKWAVASARKKKYGHPHEKVILALKKRRVPLIKTEDWGHLHFKASDSQGPLSKAP